MSDVAEVPGPYNLVEIFEEGVREFSARPLFGTKNAAGTGYDWVTFGEIGHRVDDLRGGLKSLGVGDGDGVAIIANNRVEWAVACYATYGLGARFIPMYEAELPRILKFIIEDSGAKIVLVSNQDVLEKVKTFPDEIAALEKLILIEGEGEGTMSDLERIGRENPVEAVHPDPDSIAGLIYTSGTTGNPKGVLLSHRNLSTNVTAVRHAIGEAGGPGDRTLSFLPWAHSFGQVAELHVLVKMGGCTGFAESPATIVSDITLVKPTILVAVPRIFNKVYDGIHKKMEDQGGLAKFLFDMGRAASKAKREGTGGLLNGIKLGIADRVVYSKIRAKLGGELKMSVSSSAALNVEVADFFSDLGITLYEAWGMTELSPAHTANTPASSRRGSVGQPLLGLSVKIDRSLTGEDSKDGEIVAYGPNVMQGYHNLPEATAEVLTEDGGLRSGDRGWVDEDGFLYITGRIKEQYKLENGKYVFPTGLEEAAKLSPYIENVMVEGANRKYNVAIVIPDFAALVPWARAQGLPEDPEPLVKEKAVEQLLLEEIAEKCKEFARYEIPKKLVIIAEPFTTENGILTPTLKLKRRKVMEKYGDDLAALYSDG